VEADDTCELLLSVLRVSYMKLVTRNRWSPIQYSDKRVYIHDAV